MGKATATVAAVLAVLVVPGAACRRPGHSERAARDAQDACIVALEPVARDTSPTTEQMARARGHAEAAARADRRWVPLQARLAEFEAATTPATVEALTAECRRVNDAVRAEQE